MGNRATGPLEPSSAKPSWATWQESINTNTNRCVTLQTQWTLRGHVPCSSVVNGASCDWEPGGLAALGHSAFQKELPMLASPASWPGHQGPIVSWRIFPLVTAFQSDSLVSSFSLEIKTIVRKARFSHLPSTELSPTLLALFGRNGASLHNNLTKAIIYNIYNSVVSKYIKP